MIIIIIITAIINIAIAKIITMTIIEITYYCILINIIN
jgi:hypothetical protein